MEKQTTKGKKKIHSHHHRPLIFGEVLFDEFEDGSAVLGGAPFNVAWHLNGLGLNPLFVTSVGNDAHGKQIIETMQQWDMDTSGVLVSDDHPTGKVSIKLKEGIPEFNIVPDQAYDFIDEAFTRNIASQHNKEFSMLYHGSLALRNETSRRALTELREDLDIPVFVDINLRDPWWDEETVPPSLSNATWIKLNDDELAEICRLEDINESDISTAATLLQQKLGLELLIITLGADGAWFITDKESRFGEPVPVNNMIDTVGAGDSFSAVTIYGLLKHWPIQDISDRAMAFASSICERRGATIKERQFYQDKLSTW